MKQKLLIYPVGRTITQSSSLGAFLWEARLVPSFSGAFPSYGDLIRFSNANDRPLQFESKEAAMRYAESEGIAYDVEENHEEHPDDKRTYQERFASERLMQGAFRKKG